MTVTPRFVTVMAAVGIVSLLSLSAIAQEHPDSNLQRGTFARIVKRTAPRYPESELHQNRQGWVKLSYVVTTDGEAVDPIIEDSSGNRKFERAALRVIDNWIFEPATWDGKPVEQCQNEIMISFAIKPTPTGASRTFIRRYKKIVKQMDNGDTGEAAKLIDETFDSWKMTVYEVSRLWALRGLLAEKTDNRARQLSSYRKAAANNGRWIEKDTYRSLLSRIVILELYSGQYSSALSNFEKLLDEGVRVEELGLLATAIQSLKEQLAEPRPLAVPARLSTGRQCDGCPADWQYRLLRREFSIADVEGTLEKLEIRCDWKRVIDTAREGVNWSIPESWGSCRVIVFGGEGTTFNLLEHPSSI